MSDNRGMPEQWYELAGWNAAPPQRHTWHEPHTIAIDYNDPSGDACVSVVTLQKRPGHADPGGGHTLPTSIDDARRSAILGALSAIGPNTWPASPYSRAEFKALVEQFVPKAAESAAWHPLELRIDHEPRSAYSYDLPHHAHAIAADTGNYFVGIGTRNVQPGDLALVLAS